MNPSYPTFRRRATTPSPFSKGHKSPLHKSDKMECAENKPPIDTAAMQVEHRYGASYDQNTVVLDHPTPSVRAASPSLAVLVSKFECLDSLANSGATPLPGPPGSVSFMSRSRRLRMPAANTTGSAAVASPLSDTTNMRKKPMPPVDSLDWQWDNGED